MSDNDYSGLDKISGVVEELGRVHKALVKGAAVSDKGGSGDISKLADLVGETQKKAEKLQQAYFAQKNLSGPQLSHGLGSSGSSDAEKGKEE